MKTTFRRSLTILVAAPLALIAVATTAPAAKAGTYGGDSATFSITIGNAGPGRYAIDRGGYGPQRHGYARQNRGPQARGHNRHGRGHHARRGHRGGHGHYNRYAGRGVGYGCHISYRHGSPVTVCRDGYGRPFILGRGY